MFFLKFAIFRKNLNLVTKKNYIRIEANFYSKMVDIKYINKYIKKKLIKTKAKQNKTITQNTKIKC